MGKDSKQGGWHC